MAVLESKQKEFQEKIANAPRLPGCYMYKDINGEIIYVGKAKSIFNRVKSYFNNFARFLGKNSK